LVSRQSLRWSGTLKHVMLLHIGGFQTVMLPHLLELLKRWGFKLISPEEAESDPAYAFDPNLPRVWGGHFWTK
jgi:peptidoglycan-N-acetylglucosamine deacetylase